MKGKPSWADLPDNAVVLALVNSHDYEHAASDIVRQLLAEGRVGIYVTINKPSASVSRMLEKSGLSGEFLVFVDCVTQYAGGGSRRIEKTVFVSPRNLTGISVAINEMVRSIPGKKFVIVDSLNTLSSYHSPEILQQFAHFLANRIRMQDIRGALLIADADAPTELVSVLERACDRVLHYSENPAHASRANTAALAAGRVNR